MSKKKPEKVWVWSASIYSAACIPAPVRATYNSEEGCWCGRDDVYARSIGWDSGWRVYADEDKAKVALFMKGFLACQAMYAEMFKEADDAD